jgi:pyruvate/2-oxoglutarate dehydrogenase complex dihydrolipoamide acyltransferase (E2) component
MRATLKMPKVGDAADKVLVRELMVKRGDRIAEGNLLMLVETDKANVEVPSPLAGTVVEVMVAVGDEVATGAPTFTIEN